MEAGSTRSCSAEAGAPRAAGLEYLKKNELRAAIVAEHVHSIVRSSNSQYEVIGGVVPGRALDGRGSRELDCFQVGHRVAQSHARIQVIACIRAVHACGG